MPAALQAHGSSWHKIDGTAIAWFLSTLIATLHMLPRHLPIRARLLLMGLVFMTPACSTYSMRKENVAKKKPASLKKQAFYEQCLTESIRTVYLERNIVIHVREVRRWLRCRAWRRGRGWTWGRRLA
ncbi:MAG: hypothetical protein I4O49_00465, partial [Janthinobacterium lividum]|nr:hypothetical protein [Janthinobacterium lividum]